MKVGRCLNCWNAIGYDDSYNNTQCFKCKNGFIQFYTATTERGLLYIKQLMDKQQPANKSIELEKTKRLDDSQKELIKRLVHDGKSKKEITKLIPQLKPGQVRAFIRKLSNVTK